MSFPTISEGTLGALFDEGVLRPEIRDGYLFNLNVLLYLSNPDLVRFIQTDIMSGIGNSRVFDAEVYIDTVYCCLLILDLASSNSENLCVSQDTVDHVSGLFRKSQNAFCNRILVRYIDEQIHDLIEVFCSRYTGEDRESERLFIRVSARIVYEMIEMS